MTRRMTTLLGTIQQLNESIQGLKPGDTTPIDVNPYGDDDVRKLLMNGCGELNDNKIEKIGHRVYLNASKINYKNRASAEM
jgi:hypothetical protein